MRSCSTLTVSTAANIQAQPGTAVGDLQALDNNHDLYSDFEVLDDLQVQSNVKRESVSGRVRAACETLEVTHGESGEQVFQRKSITAMGAVACLAMAVSVDCSCQRAEHTTMCRVRPASSAHQSEPTVGPARPSIMPDSGCARYQGVPPEQQRQALQNDPQFRSLPPQRQQRLEERLQRFNSLPPEQQQRVLNRMEVWEHLTPEQKQDARSMFTQMRTLPPQRRQMVQDAIRGLRGMPPEERERTINSHRFRSMFTPEERGLLKDATRLPLAPAPRACTTPLRVPGRFRGLANAGCGQGLKINLMGPGTDSEARSFRRATNFWR